jgi:hypothetical protein
MAVMKVMKEYDRHFYEVQQQSENGKWYRVAQSGYIEGGNDKLMLADALDGTRKRIRWAKGLEGFLPSELCHVGPLRIVRVHKRVQELDFDVKQALRVTRVASK